MKRRAFLALIGAASVAWSAATPAQPAAKVYRIGWLSTASSATGTLELQWMRERLRELGYVEGKNLVIEPRWANEDPAALPSLARALVELKVDVIMPIGTLAALAAKQATASIPIVFAGLTFPDRSGLITNYARPGGNVTGVAVQGEEYGKRLELLREISPRLARVALFYNDKNPGSVLAMKEVDRWARSFGIALEPYGINQKASIDAAFAAIAKNLPGAVMTTADPVVVSYRREIVAFTAQYRLLAIYPNSDFVRAGGLMYYGADTRVMHHQAADYAHRILRGARPGDLPIEQPRTFSMAINLKTARALAVQIPREVLARANEVIE